MRQLVPTGKNFWEKYSIHRQKDKRASGIGLYMVRQIAEDLSIGLSVDSHPGQGTAVRLDLP